jgi:hypothetical protein
MSPEGFLSKRCFATGLYFVPFSAQLETSTAVGMKWLVAATSVYFIAACLDLVSLCSAAQQDAICARR